jgi:hypothetical protein
MVMGKVQNHPQVQKLPFSYVIAEGRETCLVPGINIRTVGTWRDVGKWPKRDKRPLGSRNDIINFAFPNPYILQNVVEGKKLLQSLLYNHSGEEELHYEGCTIRRNHAVNGIRYYDLAIRLFVYEMMNTNADTEGISGKGAWADLAGMIAPCEEVERIVDDVETGDIASTDELMMVLHQVDDNYAAYATDYLQLLLQQQSDSLIVDTDYWLREAEEAHQQWLDMVREDAEREYQLGDVDEDFLRSFLKKVE